MPRVLIPSDNRDFVRYLAAAYRERGWDAVVGAFNFDLQTGDYDLVHLQWPEELADWQPPSDARIAEIGYRLDAWASRSKLLLTVHNLYPHRSGRDPQFRRLLDTCYERVPVLAHFTEASRKLVTAEFPAAARKRQVVTGFFNFDALLPPARDRAAARQRLGIAAGEFVVLVFGALREWAEAQLVRDGFSRAQVPHKRLLMAGRYQEFGPVWRQRWRRWAWTNSLRRTRAVIVPDFISDAKVHRVVDAADAVLVPRFSALNSGLPALAMSFGKVLIAPNCGAFPELVAGTRNPLYAPGNPGSLATAITQAAALDSHAAALENRALADRWSWAKLVEAGLKAVGLE